MRIELSVEVAFCPERKLLIIESVTLDTEMNRESRCIALCQITPTAGDVKGNASKTIQWMERAANAGAELALFGEMLLSDYDLEGFQALSEQKDGPSAAAIANAAKKFGIAVIYGYSEVEDEHYYNSLMFIDSSGKRIANYRKVHLWPATESQYTAGDALTVVDWDGALKVGLGVCVDVCMAEYVQAMVTTGGAQLVVIANALVGGRTYENTPRTIVPARAFENRCYIAYVCLAGKKYHGASRVCSPSAECIVSASSSDENMLMANIPLNTHQGVPFHYLPLRRPELYSLSSVDYDVEIPWGRNRSDDVQHFFSNRACYYDSQMTMVYNGPGIAAHALASLVVNKDAKVLDVAAGTGLVGKALADEGFTNLHALDRNDAMLECLAKKKVYSKIIMGSFEDEAKNISSGSFHTCTCVGAFMTSGFMDPAITVVELVRLVEIGGYVLLLWNKTELDYPQCQSTKKSLESVIEKVVHSGECKRVTFERVQSYLKKCEGMLCILKKII